MKNGDAIHRQQFPCEITECRYREQWSIVISGNYKNRIILVPSQGKKRKSHSMLEYVAALAWCLTCKHFKRFDNSME